jgi:hypothetical protein
LASGDISGALVLLFRTAPPQNVPEGIRESVDWFMRQRSQR